MSLGNRQNVTNMCLRCIHVFDCEWISNLLMTTAKWLSNSPADGTFITFCSVHLRINASNRLLVAPVLEHYHYKLQMNGKNVI